MHDSADGFGRWEPTHPLEWRPANISNQILDFIDSHTLQDATLSSPKRRLHVYFRVVLPKNFVIPMQNVGVYSHATFRWEPWSADQIPLHRLIYTILVYRSSCGGKIDKVQRVIVVQIRPWIQGNFLQSIFIAYETQ
jgi:hypothetical protein